MPRRRPAEDTGRALAMTWAMTRSTACCCALAPASHQQVSLAVAANRTGHDQVERGRTTSLEWLMGCFLRGTVAATQRRKDRYQTVHMTPSPPSHRSSTRQAGGSFTLCSSPACQLTLCRPSGETCFHLLPDRFLVPLHRVLLLLLLVVELRAAAARPIREGHGPATRPPHAPRATGAVSSSS